MSAAVIGKSIVIKGELSGDEDLTVEGTVEGKITLSNNNVIIGPNGRVTADVSAQTVTITGNVEGDVSASELVEITDSGSLKGNIKAPRLTIADGAFFQGSVEMQKASTATISSMPSKSAAANVEKPAVGAA